MTDREALLAAVCAAPADDLPRLAYADWCDDHGDPDRAEFIRLQIEHFRLPASDPRRRFALLPRAAELYARERWRWVSELPTPEGVRWADQNGQWLGLPAFDRGFASQLCVDGDRVLAAASATLFAATPVRTLIVQQVRSARRLLGVSAPRSLVRVEVFELSRQVADRLDDCPLLDQAAEIALPLAALSPATRDRLRARFGGRLLAGRHD